MIIFEFPKDSQKPVLNSAIQRSHWDPTQIILSVEDAPSIFSSYAYKQLAKAYKETEFKLTKLSEA